MELILYTTDSAKNVIGKTLTQQTTLTLNLRRDFDLMRPSFKLSLPPEINPFAINYCQLSEFSRFYFVDEVRSINANIWEFVCSVDVLETYKADILSSNARLRRNIKTGDYLTTNLEFTTNATVTNYESSAGFDGEDSMILTSVGGGSN